MTLPHVQVGHGPTLVLLHAFPLSRQMWRDVTAPLAASGWRVVTPDLPGFGEATDVVTTIDAMADAVAALLDELGEQTAVIGGCSMGGYVALAFAERYPERTAALVLVDTKASADSDAARANRERIAEQVTTSGSTTALAAVMIDTLLGQVTQRDRPDLVAWVREQILAASPGAVAAAQHAMAERREQFETLRRLQVPVLCIRGGDDATATADDQAAMVAAAGDVIDVTVADVGHLLPIEDPDAFVAHVGGFLGRVRTASC